MRTTIDIENDLLKELKKLAGKSGTSLRGVLNSALRSGLRSFSQQTPRKQYICPVFSMGQPTVNLDKALALSDAMEDAEVVRELELRK